MTDLEFTVGGGAEPSEGPPPHLELVFSVFQSFVEGAVITKPPNVVDPIEALDAVWHPLHLKDADAVWNRSDGIDLEVWQRGGGQSRV